MMQPVPRRSLVKVLSVFIILLLNVKSIVCNGEGDTLIQQEENVTSLIAAEPTIAAISSFSLNENGTISLSVLIIAPRGGITTKCNHEMQLINHEMQLIDETTDLSYDVEHTANCWSLSDSSTSTQDTDLSSDVEYMASFSDSSSTQYSSPRSISTKEDHVHLCVTFLCWDELKAPCDMTAYHTDGGRFKIGDDISSLKAIATSVGSSSIHCGLAENNLSHAMLYCWENQFEDGKFLVPEFLDGSGIESAKARDGRAAASQASTKYGTKDLQLHDSMASHSVQDKVAIGILLTLLVLAWLIVLCFKRNHMLRSSADSGDLLPSGADASSSEENPAHRMLRLSPARWPRGRRGRILQVADRNVVDEEGSGREQAEGGEHQAKEESI